MVVVVKVVVVALTDFSMRMKQESNQAGEISGGFGQTSIRWLLVGPVVKNGKKGKIGCRKRIRFQLILRQIVEAKAEEIAQRRSPPTEQEIYVPGSALL